MDGTTPTTTPAKVSPIAAFRREVDLMATQFKLALPEHVTVDRFTRNLLSAVQEQPDLLDCDRKSLMQSAMTAAQLGLVVGKTLGQFYIVPFYDSKKGKKVATSIPGYRGYITLARNSGEVVSVAAYEVCERDKFDYELGWEPKLVHKPGLGDRGAITHVYCVVKFKDEGGHIEIMTKADVDAIRARSKASSNGPWVTDYMMMARKTVIRRAAKYLPLSVQRLAALDAAIDKGVRATIDLEGGDVVEHETVNDGTPQIESADGAKKRGRPKSKLDEFAGQSEGVEAQAQEQNGASATVADASEPPPPERSDASQGSPGATAGGTQAAAPPYAPPKLGWGGKPATFHAALVAELAKCPTQEAVTALEKLNEGNIGFLAKQAGDLHAAWVQARDERLEALRA